MITVVLQRKKKEDTQKKRKSLIQKSKTIMQRIKNRSKV